MGWREHDKEAEEENKGIKRAEIRASHSEPSLQQLRTNAMARVHSVALCVLCVTPLVPGSLLAAHRSLIGTYFAACGPT